LQHHFALPDTRIPDGLKAGEKKFLDHPRKRGMVKYFSGFVDVKRWRGNILATTYLETDVPFLGEKRRKE
jgi:hypothetical protein